MKKLFILMLAAALVLSLTGCTVWNTLTDAGTQPATEALDPAETASAAATAAATEAAVENTAEAATETVAATESYTPETVSVSTQRTDGALDTADQFSSRDLTQNADLSAAVSYTLTSGEDITITSAGVYLLQGSAANATVVVDAGDDDKVQLVLDGVSITNDDFPAIYVKNADKVFVTTTDSDNSLSVTGSFTADGETNTDAVIFSRDDLVLNGVGALTVNSTDNGITSKDDLKITGGTITISCVSDALEANDSIRIAGGSTTVTASKDGLHVENEDDNSTGYVYICGGELTVSAGDDGIHGTTVVQIDGGTVDITAAEGIEGTWVQINGGTIHISASDDGINGASKSSAYTTAVEITGGELTIQMGQGDTDGIDSNGNLIITGGTIDVTGQSPFDYDGTCTFTGGTVIVNGVETNQITNQMMGPGGGMGGMGGGPGGGHGGWGWP